MPDPVDVLGRMRELDRRKLAAAKPAKDAQLAGRRETTRKQVQRHRARKRLAMQANTHDAVQCEGENALTAEQKTQQFQELFGPEPNATPNKSNAIRSDLVKLSRDRKAPASARVTALRTLAEMDGLVGKLQTQANETAEQPLAGMSRAQLEQELARLRAIVTGRGT